MVDFYNEGLYRIDDEISLSVRHTETLPKDETSTDKTLDDIVTYNEFYAIENISKISMSLEKFVKYDINRQLIKSESACNKFYLKNLQSRFRLVCTIDNFKCLVYNDNLKSKEMMPFLMAQHQNLFYGNCGKIIFITIIYFTNGDSMKITFKIGYDYIPNDGYNFGLSNSLFKATIEICNKKPNQKIIEKSFDKKDENNTTDDIIKIMFDRLKLVHNEDSYDEFGGLINEILEHSIMKIDDLNQLETEFEIFPY